MAGFAISAAPAVLADAGASPAISRNAAATEASTNFMIFSKVQYASHLSDVECARHRRRASLKAGGKCHAGQVNSIQSASLMQIFDARNRGPIWGEFTRAQNGLAI